MMRKKSVLFLANILLIIVLAILAYFKFSKIQILFDCECGKQPTSLLEIAGEKFPGFNRADTKAVFIFNDRPHIDTLGDVDKLYRLYNDSASFAVLFTKDFTSDYQFQFPAKRLPRYKFSCTGTPDGFGKNYFLIVKEGIVVYGISSLNFFDMNFAFQKLINPNINTFTAQLPTEKLKTKIVDRLNKKYIELLDVNAENMEKFEDFSGFSKIYFFHAGCSGCQLKNLIKGIKLERILNEEKPIIIFSIFANRFELKSLLDQDNIDLPVYIDTADEFLLASKITNDKDNPVVLTQEDLGRL
jgi:hypothetical protein